MENIQKAIEQVKKELEQAEQKRRESGNNDAARIDRDIVCANLRIGRYTQRLKNPTEPQAEVQERADCPVYECAWMSDKEKALHPMPENYLSIAKYHETEMIDQVMSDGGNTDSSMSVSAAARLADMIDRTELLRMASESTQGIPALPGEKEIADLVSALTDQNGVIPPGELERAWSGICDLYRDEWRLRLKFIDVARLLAHAACDDLIAMTRQMKAMRGEVQRIGKEKGSPDEIVKGNCQITTFLSIHQIPRHDNDRLSHELYCPKGEDL